MHVFYLHGFASSPRSGKAAFFRERLAPRGIALHAPDFNEPDFRTLTVTRMIDQVASAIDTLPAGDVALIGSSLGGFVAVHAALARPTRVVRLILLAPALDFAGTTGLESSASSAESGARMRTLGDRSLAEWERTNTLNVFHYAYGRVMPVHYGLYRDGRRYDALNAVLPMPVQVFQGRFDDAVDPATVERWSRARPNVELHMLDDDHQLQGSLEYVWKAVEGEFRSQ